MAYQSGRHFLQIPGPTNVPDRVLRAMAAPTIDHRGPEFARLAREVLATYQKSLDLTQIRYQKGDISEADALKGVIDAHEAGYLRIVQSGNDIALVPCMPDDRLVFDA